MFSCRLRTSDLHLGEIPGRNRIHGCSYTTLQHGKSGRQTDSLRTPSADPRSSSPGLSRPRLLPQREAGGGGPDGAAAGVRGHGEALRGPPAAHPLRRLGRRVRPVDRPPVPGHLPRGLVRAGGIPAAAAPRARQEW